MEDSYVAYFNLSFDDPNVDLRVYWKLLKNLKKLIVL